MNVEGKKILIIGTGKSGLAAAELLLAIKAYPVLFDGNEKNRSGSGEKEPFG